jgi:integrase
MTAATVKLTKRAIDAMVASEQRFVIWDVELKGFGVRIEPSGAKSFILRYRAGGRGSAKRFITLGKYGVITPEEARRSARDKLGLVARGSDPAQQMARQKAAPTIAFVAERFLAEHVEPKRKAATIASYRHALMARIVPDLGSLRAESVTRADVARLHGRLSTKPATANYVLAVLSSLYSWCDRQGLVPEGYNPAVRVDRFRQQGRERYLNSQELQRLGVALNKAETVGLPWASEVNGPKAKHLPRPENRKTVLDPAAVAAIRLLILTGARLREILHLRWQEIDLERGLAFLPDSKTGRKTLTLSRPALRILSELPRMASPFVIAGSKEGQPRADLQRPWAAICRSADLPGVRLHDLRHTFASVGAGESLGLPIVGKLLGHTQPQTTARYAHLDANPLRQAADLIATRLVDAMNSSTEELDN